MFRCQAVYRIHGDKASQQTGERVDNSFNERGVVVDKTAGFEPNANPRAVGGIGLAKTQARITVAQLGIEG